MRHLELHLFLDFFPERYTENDADTAIVNRLKRASDRRWGYAQKKGLEVVSADLSTDKIEHDNELLSSEEEEHTSSASF